MQSILFSNRKRVQHSQNSQAKEDRIVRNAEEMRV